MPIDTNLANWNKENEPSEKKTPTNYRRTTNVQQGVRAPARRSTGQLKTPLKVSSPLSPQGTPKQQSVSMFEKSSLKRGVQHEEDEQRWFKIQQVFSSKRSNCHTEEPLDKSGDEQELMDELLDLCSWWSDTEQGSVQRHCQPQHVEEGPEEADEPLFQEFANYLSKLSKEVEPVKSRKEARREVLMPLLISDSDFDLNASF